MGMFTEEKYKYWEYSVKDKNCIINMIHVDVDEKEKELNTVVEKIKQMSQEHKALQEKRDKEKDSAKKKESNIDLLAVQNKINAARAKGIKAEKELEVFKRYYRITYNITRLKDKYSRQEAIHIQILNDDIEDGIIITSTSDVDNDINKLEKFGISLYPTYLDELVKIIKDKYFDIAYTERSYIDNDVPVNAVDAFANLCREEIKKNPDAYIKKSEMHYDVPHKELNEWYKDSQFRRFTLSELKEALVIHGYMDTPTKGRLDNTIEGQKVVRFIKNIMDNGDSGKKAGDKNE